MVKRLNERVREFFLSRNYFVSKRGSVETVNGLIRKLHPAYPQDRLIRLGGAADGGYLVPDDLGGITKCMSPGVSDEASFESDLLERGIRSWLCDYSVDGPPEILKECTFDRKFLGAWDDESYWTLESWMRKYNLGEAGEDMLLQMDIEGFEYPVLLSTPREILRKFRVLVIEFHDLFDLFNPTSFRTMEQTFDKLLLDFRVVHIHPNIYGQSVIVDGFEYPRIVEMTLIRHDRFNGQSGPFKFPHPLDCSCSGGNRELILPEHWHG